MITRIIEISPRGHCALKTSILMDTLDPEVIAQDWGFVCKQFSREGS